MVHRRHHPGQSHTVHQLQDAQRQQAPWVQHMLPNLRQMGPSHCRVRGPPDEATEAHPPIGVAAEEPGQVQAGRSGHSYQEYFGSMQQRKPREPEKRLELLG